MEDTTLKKKDIEELEKLVKIAEEEGRDYKEISVDMKQLIVTRKLEQNPMLGMIATFEALLKMAEEKANK